MNGKIEVRQLGPRQQFIGTNGLRQKLVSKRQAWKEIEGKPWLDWAGKHSPKCLCGACAKRREAQP